MSGLRGLAEAVVLEEPPRAHGQGGSHPTAQAATTHSRGDERGPAVERRDVPVDRGLPRLDHDLAEQDDHEQPEALREVMRIERLVGVDRPQGVQVARAPRSRDAVRSSCSSALDSPPMAIAHST